MGCGNFKVLARARPKAEGRRASPAIRGFLSCHFPIRGVPFRGVPSEVVLNEEDGMKSPCAVKLHNAVTVSQQRLGKRAAQLSSARMNEVCAALRFSLGCDAN